MIRGMAPSSLIATAVPLRRRGLGNPEAARPWNTSGWGRAAGRPAEGLVPIGRQRCRPVGRRRPVCCAHAGQRRQDVP